MKKRILSVFLICAILIFGCQGVFAEDAITWRFDETSKTIYVEGTGALTNGNPWKDYLNKAEHIVISPGITSIGSMVFAACGTVKTVTIPEGVTSIGDRAFCYSDYLEQVSLPDSLTSIGANTFEFCISLKEITLPKNVSKIGEKAFSNCFALSAINVSDENAAFCQQNGVLFSKDKTTLIVYPAGKADAQYIIPDGTVTVGRKAFAYHSYIESLVFPDSVQKIDDFGIYFCQRLKDVQLGRGLKTIGQKAMYGCGLTEITIPRGVSSIGEKAFLNCKSLAMVNLPDTVSKIGADAFSGCSSHLTVGCFGGAALEYAQKNNIPVKNVVRVMLDGKELFFDEPACVTGGCTMVPMRKIFEELGAKVDWDGNTQTVSASRGDTVITFKIGEAVLYKNGAPIQLLAPAVISNSRTLVHVRAVAEALGAQVDWDGEKGLVTISSVQA